MCANICEFRNKTHCKIHSPLDKMTAVQMMMTMMMAAEQIS